MSQASWNGAARALINNAWPEGSTFRPKPRCTPSSVEKSHEERAIRTHFVPRRRAGHC